MNKLVDDVAEFIKEREQGEAVAAETEESLRDRVVLFANELSEKYKEHVSVELVDSLMISYQDSFDKTKDDKESSLKQ